MSDEGQPKACPHPDFQAMVGVARLEDTGGFIAEIRIHCTHCALPFEFLGLNPGMDLQGACVSLDGQEARIAITPKGVRPNPLRRLAFGVRSQH